MAGTIIRLESLTRKELRDIKDAFGRPMADLFQSGDLDAAYALEWIRRRRNGSPDLPLSALDDVALEDVIGNLEGVALEADPTTAGSGNG